jgi:hypothetical protein
LRTIHHSKLTERTLSWFQGVGGPGRGAQKELYVFLDPLCPAGVALAKGRELKGIEALGIRPFLVPIAIINGSIPHGEAFLATGSLTPDKEVLFLRKLMFEWADDEEGRLRLPVPKDPKEWFGPSMVMENTYRFRSLLQGTPGLVSPTVIYPVGNKLKVIQGYPTKAEFLRMQKDLRPVKGMALDPVAKAGEAKRAKAKEARNPSSRPRP